MIYLDMSTVVAHAYGEPPRSGQTRSGYGSRLPTGTMLRVAKRWHRVYAICWGTGSTCYIRKGGVPHYIATGEL